MSVTLSPSIRKIAVFRALHLGDFICATPALRALRSRFPSAEITLIGLPWAEDVLRRLPLVDRFEVFPGFPGVPETPYVPERTGRFLERMQRKEFDLALQLHGDGCVSNGFLTRLGARLSLGYSTASESDLRLTRVLPWIEEENEVRRWSRLVRLLGAISDDQVVFPIGPEEEVHARKLLDAASTDARPRIGIHCGAKLPSRRWPIERFASLGKALSEHAGATLVLTGAEHERPLTARLRRELQGPVIDLTGRTSLGTLGGVIGQLDLLVTNDTGVSHIAAATRTPSVVLFGPSDPRRWAPIDRKRHRIVDAASAGHRHEDVLADLDVDRVLETALYMLRAHRRESSGLFGHPAIHQLATAEKS
jgi:ADP-heptose:LPS heptosyltransferase